MSTAMRSAADIDEVGGRPPAAFDERIESTRSCCPSSRHASCWEVMVHRLRKLSAEGERALTMIFLHGPIRLLAHRATRRLPSVIDFRGSQAWSGCCNVT